MATPLPAPTQDEVRAFLAELHTRMDTNAGGVQYGIRIKPRIENQTALFELDISALDRIEYIRNLKSTDACQLLQSDVKEEEEAGRRLWVFGIRVKKSSVYVKIQFGEYNEAPLCISFHKARFKLEHLFS